VRGWFVERVIGKPPVKPTGPRNDEPIRTELLAARESLIQIIAALDKSGMTNAADHASMALSLIEKELKIHSTPGVHNLDQ
jgi:hypothetical protein